MAEAVKSIVELENEVKSAELAIKNAEKQALIEKIHHQDRKIKVFIFFLLAKRELKSPLCGIPHYLYQL